MRGGDLEPPAAGTALFRVIRARARRDAQRCWLTLPAHARSRTRP